MRGFWLSLERDGVVRAHGELDGATGDRVASTVLRTRSDTVVLDLRQLAFMDCAGYAALVRARSALAAEGRALRLRDACGEPAFLLELIDGLERDPNWRPARVGGAAARSQSDPTRAFNAVSERACVRGRRMAAGA